MPRKIATARAVMQLEMANVLPSAYPLDPKLEAAAVAMYRSVWWHHVPVCTWQGKPLPRGAWQCRGNWVGTGDATIGEMPWR